MRLDLALNDLVASAIATGEITVLSDGSPWRPLIHVSDMARAIEWGIMRQPDAGGRDYLVVNAGSDEWNYQIKDVAHAVAEVNPGIKVKINTDAPPDNRSYRVDFGNFAALAPNHQPQVGLRDAVEGLRAGLESMGFSDRNFRESRLIRLYELTGLKAAGLLDEALRWRDGRLAATAQKSQTHD